MNSLFHKKSIEELSKILKNKKNKDFLLKTSYLNLEKNEKKLKALAHYSKKIVKLYQKDMSNNYKKNLFYIPFGIKDIFNVKDFKNEKGSSIYKNYYPENNARVVDSLVYSGCIPFAKTTTSEFAVHKINKTRNPYDFSKTPGTSSSGSAVSVASGYFPFALASQTAGSIVRPASYCNVWGFKPSFGLIPRTGMLKTTDTLDTPGFFCSNGKSIKYLLDNIRVRGKNYPFVYKNIDKNISLINNNSKTIKIGFVKTHTWDLAENYVKNSILNLIDKVANNSKFEIEKIKLPTFYNDIHQHHDVIYNKSLSYYFKNEFKFYKKYLSKGLLNMIEKGKMIDNNTFNNSINFQNKIILSSNKIFKKYDAIFSLSTAESAPLRNKKSLDDPSLMWTFAHMPSLSAPIFRCPSNMPFGIQITSRKYNDYKLLKTLNELFNQKLFYPNPYDNA